MKLLVKGGAWTIVDDGTILPTVKLYLVGYSHSSYVAFWHEGKNTLLHRFLLKATKGQVIDHVNGDRLDNRLANLRFCSYTENARNRKVTCVNRVGCAGVYQMPSGNYKAVIRLDKKLIYLGTYRTLQKATRVRQEAERAHFGEYSRLSSNKAV